MCNELSFCMDFEGVVYVGKKLYMEFDGIEIKEGECEDKDSHSQICEFFKLSEDYDGVAKFEALSSDGFILVKDYEPEWLTSWHVSIAEKFAAMLSDKQETESFFWLYLRGTQIKELPEHLKDKCIL